MAITRQGEVVLGNRNPEVNLYNMEGLLNFNFQVINAARVLAARPKSKVAQENIDVFRDAWINQVFQYFF